MIPNFETSKLDYVKRNKTKPVSLTEFEPNWE